MKKEQDKNDLTNRIHNFIKESFTPHFGKLTDFKSNPVFSKLCELGSRLWYDTGSIEDAAQRWTREFSALTTNNTLLNKEIQKGQYDSVIKEAAKILDSFPELSEKEKILEIAFVLNAKHALRLVEKFDAYVSVEEHTDLAGDVRAAVEYARRFYAVCPERFIIKIPFTPAGLLATRKLSAQCVPVNHTLGFSARQNYLIARIANPAYVNVFLGRLNSFVADNKLGDGTYVGEKATLASQKAVKQLRESKAANSLQIGASFRAGQQVRDLAGIDVMTMPVKAADEFLAMNLQPAGITDRTGEDYVIGLNPDVDAEQVNLSTLWDIDDKLVACIGALEKEDLDRLTPKGLVDFFAAHGCSDVLVPWSRRQIAISAEEGKIPKLENWKQLLSEKSIGFDSLMNLAGLNSFAADQKAMDERVRRILAK